MYTLAITTDDYDEDDENDSYPSYVYSNNENRRRSKTDSLSSYYSFTTIL